MPARPFTLAHVLRGRDSGADLSAGSLIVPVASLMPLDFRWSMTGFQHHLPEPIILNQMVELADCRLVWRSLIAKNSR